MTITPSKMNGRVADAVPLYMQSIVKVAYAYLKSVHDAEDIAQETFLAYLHFGKAFSSPEHEKAWLIRVCINKCKNVLKSGWHQNRQPLPEDLATMPKEHNDILDAVMSLEEKYRIPVHLYFYEGYAIKQIAQLLSLPSATVGTRLARAKVQLKTQLGGAYDE